MKRRPPFEPTREFHALESVWDDVGHNSRSLGCANCPYLKDCGGMHVEAALYSCIDLCTCADKAVCDMICPGKPENFVRGYREVGGLALGNIQRAPYLRQPSLPNCIPFVGNGYSRTDRLGVPFAVISLYDIVHMKHGTVKVQSASELTERFKLAISTQVILTGVERDFLLEPWWGFSNRTEILGALKNLGIAMVTSPNYSVLTNVPRPDNLYNMKRIGIAWAEIVNAGIPCALHVNASTEEGYRQWAAFIRDRKEVSSISFEFGTGAGFGNRIDWHIAQLCELAQSVDRPLTLIVRGGKRKLYHLQQAFHRVVFVDTDSFARAIKRQKAYIADGKKLRWAKTATKEGEPLDTLLAHNISMVHASLPQTAMIKTDAPIMRRLTKRATYDANDQAIQPSPLSDGKLPAQAGAITRQR